MVISNIMEIKRKFRPDSNLKLMDQVLQVLRYHHYAYRTEQTYCNWIEQYIKFHKCKKHPREMGGIKGTDLFSLSYRTLSFY
ncbi:MAG: phage integrase N-terminal SAM-like domain-containing protein [Planctomycetota bacterium]